MKAKILCALSLVGLAAFVSLIGFMFLIAAVTEDSQYHAVLASYWRILVPLGIASPLVVLAFRREVGDRLDQIFS